MAQKQNEFGVFSGTVAAIGLIFGLFWSLTFDVWFAVAATGLFFALMFVWARVQKKPLRSYGRYFWILILAWTLRTSWGCVQEFADTGSPGDLFFPILFGWLTWYFYQRCTGKMTDENDPFLRVCGKCNLKSKK